MARLIQSTAAKPIGITVPITDGNTGFFQQTFDTLSQVKNNIYNLLNTRQGERRMQPTFGSRLWTLNFEPNNFSVLKDQAIQIVSEDIAAWIPNVTVTDITANLLTTSQINTNTDMYMLQVAVSFSINLTKQSDTVIVNVVTTM
jgi:phage baseplate assembly protein W